MEKVSIVRSWALWVVVNIDLTWDSRVINRGRVVVCGVAGGGGRKEWMVRRVVWEGVPGGGKGVGVGEERG